MAPTLRPIRARALWACLLLATPGHAQVLDSPSPEMGAAADAVIRAWVERFAGDFGPGRTFHLNSFYAGVGRSPERGLEIPRSLLERLTVVRTGRFRPTWIDCLRVPLEQCGVGARGVVVAFTGLTGVGTGSWWMGVRAIGYVDGDPRRPRGRFYVARLRRQGDRWVVIGLARRSVY
jgi:hypothetical protein